MKSPPRSTIPPGLRRASRESAEVKGSFDPQNTHMTQVHNSKCALVITAGGATFSPGDGFLLPAVMSIILYWTPAKGRKQAWRQTNKQTTYCSSLSLLLRPMWNFRGADEAGGNESNERLLIESPAMSRERTIAPQSRAGQKASTLPLFPARLCHISAPPSARSKYFPGRGKAAAPSWGSEINESFTATVTHPSRFQTGVTLTLSWLFFFECFVGFYRSMKAIRTVDFKTTSLSTRVSNDHDDYDSLITGIFGCYAFQSINPFFNP